MPRPDDEDRFFPYVDPLDLWFAWPRREGRVYPGQPLPLFPRPPRPQPQPGRRVEISEPPRDEGRGPLPPVPVKLPTTPPPPPVQTPASIPDQMTGRYVPRGARTTTGVLRAVLTRTGVLAWVLGTLVFGPYFGYGNWDTRARFPLPSGGPPRRRAPPRTATPSDPDWWTRYEPEARGPRRIGGIFYPDYGVDPATRRLPRVSDPRTLPTRPGAVPRPRPTVQPLPSPTGWTLGNPVPGPGYDPYTYTPPAPAPRAPARPFPRTRDVPFPWPSNPFLDPRSVPRGAPGLAPRPLTPRPRLRELPEPLTGQPVRPPRPVKPPGLTPIQEPVPRSLAQPLRTPQKANPCTTERTERRRRQRECQRYTTKTIRVCADK